MSHDPALLDAIDDERAERAALARELDQEARLAAMEDRIRPPDPVGVVVYPDANPEPF